jgi:solute carrier family 13 (sodium-dependent dicarboxylate transporter), member 2/3/5
LIDACIDAIALDDRMVEVIRASRKALMTRPTKEMLFLPLAARTHAEGLLRGVLILFGGGLALAEAIDASGLATWIGNSVAVLGSLPSLALVLAVALLVVLLGELASNTAIAALFLPIAAATALGIGREPLFLTLPVALAASIGFMLPVATPPNAIVLDGGAVTARQMLRAGIILDLASVLVVSAVAVTVGRWVFAAG